MAKLTTEDKEKIISDWKVGISQNQLAKNYNVSPATINKLCKGIKQDNIEIVNTKVSLTKALQEKSEYELNSIDKKVNDMLRRERLVFGAGEKIIKKADSMIDKVDTAADLKALSDTIDKTSLTLGVSQRHASSQVNIQNTNATQITKITREIIE